MVKLRLEGLPEDVANTLSWLRRCFVVVEESPVYPNRQPSKFVRQYVTVKAEIMPAEDKQDGR